MPIIKDNRIVSGKACKDASFVFIRESEFLIRRLTFQEYKIRYNIESNEYNDLDIGYEILHSFGIVFIPEILAEEIFDV